MTAWSVWARPEPGAHFEATSATIEKFGRYLVGKDADHISHHWDTLHRFGNYDGAVTMAAISAIDIALWDLKGKRLERPIYDLLGGPLRDRIRVYGQALGETAEKLIESCRNLSSHGYTAIGHINPFLDGAGAASSCNFARSMDDAINLAFAISGRGRPGRRSLFRYAPSLESGQRSPSATVSAKPIHSSTRTDKTGFDGCDGPCASQLADPGRHW